jgi:hypothetical protein
MNYNRLELQSTLHNLKLVNIWWIIPLQKSCKILRVEIFLKSPIFPLLLNENTLRVKSYYPNKVLLFNL